MYTVLKLNHIFVSEYVLYIGIHVQYIFIQAEHIGNPLQLMFYVRFFANENRHTGILKF